LTDFLPDITAAVVGTYSYQSQKQPEFTLNKNIKAA